MRRSTITRNAMLASIAATNAREMAKHARNSWLGVKIRDRGRGQGGATGRFGREAAKVGVSVEVGDCRRLEL